MYIPDAFILTDEATIREVVAAHPLSTFATNGVAGPAVTHLPLVLRDEGDEKVIYGHFARANPHWKALDGKCPAIAIFRGAEGYISPDWYATKQETGRVVPTWNYVAVHARGVPRCLEGRDEIRRAIDALTDAMEAPRDAPWKVGDAPERFTESMVRGIVAFRMVVTDLRAQAKLSQNKTDADFSGAVKGLREDRNERLADAMLNAARG